MGRRSVVLLSLVLAAGIAVAVVRSPLRASPTLASPPARSSAGAAPLPAEGYRIEGGAVTQTVPAVGTLIANESVNVVSESSRRVVAVAVAEGALVEKGQLLFKLDDADLRADLQRLEGRRGLAAATESRQRELIADGLVSQQDYDRASSELLAIDGEIAALKVDLAKAEIRAPFAGRLGLRRVSEGAYVSPNTLLTTLQDLSQLKLDFTLPERYAHDVRPGQAFTFRVEARGETFRGTVAALEPQIDPGTRSLVVRGVVPNRGGQLQPGASASVEIAVDSVEGVLIPARALVPGVKGHSVFVLRDGKAAEQPVEIGIRTDEQVQIVSGLEPGDTVLTSNLLRLRPGIPVRLQGRAD